MCGISGYVGADVRDLDHAASGAMRSAIAYRGHDDRTEWGDERNVRLFHTRLTIIDPQTGRQPMSTPDGRLTLIFNGAIYNYIELRKEYERLGAQFGTHSDTEAILQGYALKGPAVCDDLNGMFAFAIWDRDARELFLARDRVGKKPLYWTRDDRHFCFASTIDAFRDLPGWSGRLDHASLALYGLLGAVPLDNSVFEGVHSLEPGTRATVSLASTEPRIERYWCMDFSTKSNSSSRELEREYEDLLVEATRIRLRSDVPIGLTFSGGVDSGSIAWACAKRLDTELDCYTIDYDTPEDPSPETANARAAAGALGLPWQHIQFDHHRDLLPELTTAYAHYDEPCQQMALVYSERLYREIRPNATVVLSGNGADELFTGYVGDERIRQRDLLSSALGWARPLFNRSPRLPDYLRLPPVEAFRQTVIAQAGQHGGAEMRERVAPIAQRIAERAEESGVSTWLDYNMFNALTCATRDTNYRLPDISGYAAQVEVRSPFLDHRMIEFAARLPARMKVSRVFSHTGNKHLPRAAYRRMVPPAVADSPKRGMAYNVRWDLSVARDPAYLDAFKRAYEAIDGIEGLDAAPYRSAWQAYIGDVNAERTPATAGTMMNGFMLGAWIEREVG
jgi:asparagine synthase (glutamine-hydrolysing)